MDWEAVKDRMRTGYRGVAQFFLFQNIMMYLFACVTAHSVLGLTSYIAFLYHCCQWKGR